MSKDFRITASVLLFGVSGGCWYWVWFYGEPDTLEQWSGFIYALLGLISTFVAAPLADSIFWDWHRGKEQ